MKTRLLPPLLLALLCVFLSPGMSRAQEGDESPPPEPPLFEPFVIRDIRLEGLKRFDPGVVFNRLQAAPGDTFDAAAAVEVIDTLYKTGYFRSVEVLRDGEVLVVRIRENPTIAEVGFSGGEEFPEESLLQLLSQAGITKARVFDRSAVDAAAKAIEQAYVDKNFYQATVETVISPLPRNRLAVLFKIEEGAEAAIRSIDIVGNDFFSDWTLKRLMDLEARSPFNFFTDNYRYSESRLNTDIERIRTLYYEAGYLKFKLLGRQVEVSAAQKDIDIIIRLEEGPSFAVSRAVIVGEYGVAEERLTPFINQFEGDIYSGQISEETTRALRDFFADLGHAKAEVSFDTVIDDAQGTVEVIYTVNEGPVQFVRRIDIIGNTATRDEVIRRELLIFEKERYSLRKINISQNRLRRLGYFTSARIETVPVIDGDNEVDLVIHIAESGTGKFNIGVGFSTDGGVSFEASLDTPNIFGSGNDFRIAGKLDDDSKELELGLDQFYYTDEGVSRHIDAFFRKDDAGDSSSSYSVDDYGVKYGYGIPFTEEGKYFVYAAYERVKINSASTVAIYQEFIDKHTNQLDVLKLEAALQHDTRDAALAPSSGHRAVADVEVGVPPLDLKYYYLNYTHDFYKALKKFPTKPVLHLQGGAGYGDGYGGDVYPFYRRFLLGGTRTLRGFKSDSIGYANDSVGNALGGRLQLYGSVELAVETKLFESQRLYLVPFVDAGIIGEDLRSAGSARASGGLEFRWVSPIGPLSFSYVKPLKKKPGDDLQNLQFSISSF